MRVQYPLLIARGQGTLPPPCNLPPLAISHPRPGRCIYNSRAWSTNSEQTRPFRCKSVRTKSNFPEETFWGDFGASTFGPQILAPHFSSKRGRGRGRGMEQPHGACATAWTALTSLQSTLLLNWRVSRVNCAISRQGHRLHTVRAPCTRSRAYCWARSHGMIPNGWPVTGRRVQGCFFASKPRFFACNVVSGFHFRYTMC